MRITYLIGNGFDIGLGLKTGYKSFIEWYCQQPSQGDEEKWLKKQMKDKPEQWSDAELAFGALKFDDEGRDSIETYDRCSALFTRAFHDYLKKENDRFLVGADFQNDIALQFLQRVVGIDSFMTTKCVDDFQKRLGNVSVSIQFITFNYTDTLEKILGIRMGASRKLEIERRQGQRISVTVDGVLHAHGTLKDNYVFGVDDPSQIADEKVRGLCERTGGILKEASVKMIGVQDRYCAMDALRKSELLVTYGLSFGETDHSWWEVVYDVFRNRNVPIVICPYDIESPTFGRSILQQTSFYDHEKKRLFATLIKRTPTLLPEIESIKVPRITVLEPAMVADGIGNDYKCDYLGLHGIGAKCIGKGVAA